MSDDKIWGYKDIDNEEQYYSAQDLIKLLIKDPRVSYEAKQYLRSVDSLIDSNRYVKGNDLIQNLIDGEEIGAFVGRFEVKTLAKQKTSILEWDPKDFLEAARKYFNLTPKKDLVQSGEKAWCAASYQLKLRFLEKGIFCPSHPGLKVLQSKVLEKTKNLDKQIALEACWKIAERMHKIHYSDDNLDINDFESGLSKVEYYVEQIQLMPASVFDDIIKDIKSNGLKDENLFLYDTGKNTRRFCKKTHNYGFTISSDPNLNKKYRVVSSKSSK